MRFKKGVVNFMVIYRVIHKYKTDKHFEIKEIGVFDSYKKATDAIDIVKNKNGFKDYQDCFSIKKLFKLFKPALFIGKMDSIPIISTEDQIQFAVIKKKN